jgi:dTDP-4-amino-4,6-dideoxygalactose transaminase
MTVALRAMASLAPRGTRHVVVPAYTCYSVPAAIERAGLIPVPCDINPSTLSPDLGSLERACSRPVLAIVTANLFGIPNELTEIEKFARSRGIFMLDDAAQALGACLDGRPVGGFGDIGLFSFDRGKNISTMQGGALVGRAGKIASAVEEEWRRLPVAGRAETFATIAKLAPYVLLLPPSRYGVVTRLPFLALGETRYELRYPITRMSPLLEGVALEQLPRIAALRQSRSQNAFAFRSALEGVPRLHFVTVSESAEAAYPRFPVRIESRQLRDEILTALKRSGIGASGFYPKSLVDVPRVSGRMPRTTDQFRGAREVAASIITLPTHAYVPADLAIRVRDVVIAAVSAAG